MHNVPLTGFNLLARVYNKSVRLRTRMCWKRVEQLPTIYIKKRTITSRQRKRFRTDCNFKSAYVRTPLRFKDLQCHNKTMSVEITLHSFQVLHEKSNVQYIYRIHILSCWNNAIIQDNFSAVHSFHHLF